MAAETYKYFRPDGNLRAAYGGAAIVDGGDTAEVSPATLTQRHICRVMGWPTAATRFMLDQGVATDTLTWLRVSDLLYPDIVAAGALSEAELATVQSAAPAGWVRNSKSMNMQPDPRRKTIILRGDSICDGLGTTNGKKDIHFSKAVETIDGLLNWNDDVTTLRDAYTPHYRLLNMSLGGSSFGNTVTASSYQYPQVEMLAYNQRTRTIPMNSPDVLLVYALTNDLPYDLSLTPAQNWSRAQYRLDAARTEFPLVRLGIITNYKRSEDATLNGRINTYNNLVRAGAAGMTADVCDIEGLCSICNIITGNTATATTDGTHYTSASHLQMATDAVVPFIRRQWP